MKELKVEQSEMFKLFLPLPITGRRKKALITYSEVLVGTRNFHPDLKIRESMFAEVYHGRRGNESFGVKVFKQVL